VSAISQFHFSDQIQPVKTFATEPDKERNKMLLEGKVAIVTAGGGLNIGRSYCRALAREGAAVVVADVDEAGATETVREITENGGQAFHVVTDVSKADQVQAMVDCAVSTYGEVDILVNHAGTGVNLPIEQVTDELWDRAMGITLRGTFMCVRAVVPLMQ
jgi:3-oxoacyl-[acyl-carrier protein] reductase